MKFIKFMVNLRYFYRLKNTELQFQIFSLLKYFLLFWLKRCRQHFSINKALFLVNKDYLILKALDQVNLVDYHFNHCIYNQNPGKFQAKTAKLYIFCKYPQQMTLQLKQNSKFIFYASLPSLPTKFAQHK